MVGALVVLLAGTTGAFAKKKGCVRVQDGILLTSESDVIETRFDDWGYNYQARMFNGKYCDACHGADWCQDYQEDDLVMKWNDAWLSNRDCDGNGLLDRHLGTGSYIGSGAWMTNHQDGVYLDEQGNKQRWNYFVKIVAAPVDASVEEGRRSSSMERQVWKNYVPNWGECTSPLLTAFSQIPIEYRPDFARS